MKSFDPKTLITYIGSVALEESDRGKFSAKQDVPSSLPRGAKEQTKWGAGAQPVPGITYLLPLTSKYYAAGAFLPRPFHESGGALHLFVFTFQ